MASPVSLLPSIAPLERPSETAIVNPASSHGQPDFQQALLDAIGEVRHAENSAEEAALRLAAGDPAMGIHETMIAAEKAAITMRYAVTLKNRALEAYRELMNTPV
ncbi:MAG: flagellar hook-basal body complex protein FliE [Pseudomonadota bacterium]